MEVQIYRCLQCSEEFDLEDVFSCSKCEEGPFCDPCAGEHIEEHMRLKKMYEAKSVDEAFERRTP